MEATAALAVLREVVAWFDRKQLPGAQTLAIWDDPDLGLVSKKRFTPSGEKRIAWANTQSVAAFATWPAGRRNLTKPTRRRAEQDVARMITAPGPVPTTAAVDAHLAERPHARRLRWAWGLFVGHCDDAGDDPMPGAATAGARGRPRLSNMAKPTPPVCEAMRVLATRFTVTGLHKLRVSDCRGERGERAMMVGSSLGQKLVKLTIEEDVAVKTLREWAGNRGDAALVPRKSGEKGGCGGRG